ncbi:peroxidase P7 [Amborella trichopoda]|uniref:Peroxidase n=1 Tax=Amborella trichopoda TaxID=13333 RepID=W1P3M5_AMBTC|nr:peroxidase P7 [Amborella trichopoda]ERN01565.1 hypothetical protein AMTR_s00002p00271820 [Amborella trichopoda]|eukprot:XP_006838996.1 peroxidase P7 [Amborella trichopoda]
MAANLKFLIVVAAAAATVSVSDAQLSSTYYDGTCPTVFDMVKSVVRSAINREKRVGASIVRLFFHDCFVNGCDGGLLLDDNLPAFESEKNALPNKNSARGFEVIDKIKAATENVCKGVVSCADILAIATRDSVVELGGPSWQVLVGRRDARTANKQAADTDLPPFSANLTLLINMFQQKNFTARELVALSGAHSIGMARCTTFRDHLYNNTNLDPIATTDLKANCPQSGGDDNLVGLDHQSPNRFGNNYFQGLMKKRGLLNSDQVLFNAGSTDDVVRTYGDNAQMFSDEFASAMVKMGNMNPLTGSNGEIRTNCRKIN